MSTNFPNAGVKDRVFPQTSRQLEGRRRKIHMIVCGSPSCMRTEEIFDNTATNMPSDVIRRKFTQKNWHVGDRDGDDRCPDCVDSERAERRRKNGLKKDARHPPLPSTLTATVVDSHGSTAIITGVADMPATAAPPTAQNEMTIDDRRIIFLKLSEVYLNKDEGYSTPWTDAVVAKDLAVPLAWVSKTRDEFFGPAKDNGEVRELLTKIEAIAAEVASALKMADTLRKDGSELIQRAQQVNATINTLQRTVEHLTATAARIEKALS